MRQVTDSEGLTVQHAVQGVDASTMSQHVFRHNTEGRAYPPSQTHVIQALSVLMSAAAGRRTFFASFGNLASSQCGWDTM